MNEVCRIRGHLGRFFFKFVKIHMNVQADMPIKTHSITFLKSEVKNNKINGDKKSNRNGYYVYILPLLRHFTQSNAFVKNARERQSQLLRAVLEHKGRNVIGCIRLVYVDIA